MEQAAEELANGNSKKDGKKGGKFKEKEKKPLSIDNPHDDNIDDEQSIVKPANSKDDDAQLSLYECVTVSVNDVTVPVDMDIATARQLHWHDFDNPILFHFELKFN